MQTTVDRLEEDDGRVRAVVTSTGERIAADMVLVGIGAVASTELAETAGLATGNGIRVDPQMRTSTPEILAIGDAVNFRHWHSGADVRLESVQNATDQAKLAARTISGHERPYHERAVVLVRHRRYEAADGRPADGDRPHRRGGRPRRKPLFAIPLSAARC